MSFFGMLGDCNKCNDDDTVRYQKLDDISWVFFISDNWEFAVAGTIAGELNVRGPNGEEFPKSTSSHFFQMRQGGTTRASC